MKHSVKIVGKTIPLVDNQRVKTITDFIVYMARVSNPKTQELAENPARLIKYLIDNRHWSPFEMCNIAIEIEAPRDISRQILRHASARFQEFSQRYAEVQNFTIREIRAQDAKNRQNSIDIFTLADKKEFQEDCHKAIDFSRELYHKWLDRGGAKECCRVFLPEGLTMSRLYMNAPVRTWLHYLSVREEEGVTQKEHVMIANAIRKALHEIEPEIFK